MKVVSIKAYRHRAYLERQFEDSFAFCWPEGASEQTKEGLQAAFEAGYGLCEIDQQPGLIDRARRWLKH